MRQLVVAVLAYIVLQLYLPSLWSKLMSEAPSWVSAWITFGIALICIAFVGFSNPVYSRLANPSTNPWSSTLIAAALLAGIGATAWWQFAVPHESPSEVVTLKNVNTHVRRWVFALPDFLSGSRIEEEDRADLQFTYHVIFSDSTGIAVSRNKDQWGRFITIATALNPGGDFPAAYNKLSDSQRQRFIRDVGIEIVRAKIPVGNIDPSKPIVITRRIPIAATLTDVAFYDSIREMHYWLRLIIDTEARLFAEIQNDENK
jgi:hypothetical protein